MIKLIAKWILKTEIEKLDNSISILEKNESNLLAKLDKLESIELQWKVAQMYIDGDEEVFNLIEWAEKKSRFDSISQYQARQMNEQSRMMHNQAYAGLQGMALSGRSMGGIH